MRFPFEVSTAIPTTNERGQTPESQQRKEIFLIGAGGTGARVAALLPKLCPDNVTIRVIDPDVVEERNLLRQHFIARDIGRPKAEVIAERLLAAYGDREDVNITASMERFEVVRLTREFRYGSTGNYAIYLGCVDSHAGRVGLHEQMRVTMSPSVWIDAGNTTRYGQVVLSYTRWPVNVSTAFLAQAKSTRIYLPHGGSPSQFLLTYDGVGRQAPTLLEAAPEEEVSCGLRIDPQTVAINQMAATVMGSVLAAVVDGLPIAHSVYEFSTLPTMVKAVPFQKASGYKVRSTGTWWPESPYEVVRTERIRAEAEAQTLRAQAALTERRATIEANLVARMGQASGSDIIFSDIDPPMTDPAVQPDEE